MTLHPTDRGALGRTGEDVAVRLLEARGHEVLARRFRVRHGEIDLITRSGSHLYFTEVKTRSVALEQDLFGGGVEAIGARKRRRMTKVAQIFIGRHDLGAFQPHFALATVVPASTGYRVRFLPDAFDAAA